MAIAKFNEKVRMRRIARHRDDLVVRTFNSASKRERGFAVCGRQPVELAIADWLEDLAVYGIARGPLDAEIAYQLSLAVENWYLVRLALGYRSRPRQVGRQRN